MSPKYRVLVVDDERIVRVTTTRQLSSAGYTAEAVSSAEAALECLEQGEWQVVLTDLRMPGMDGLSFLSEVKRRFPGVGVILMTAHGTVESAVSAMKDGAADFLTKPFRFDELEIRLRKLEALRRTEAELEALREILDVSGDNLGLVGQSPGIQSVRERIKTIGDSNAPVLIIGETGTGKEVVARAISRCAKNRRGEMVPIGCGTIPKEIAESQLFGHEKGSFTGAAQMRKGSFERADGGVLLLDDVDDLPLELQVKLLRVLQEGEITRVGGSKTIEVDVRVLATTKVDLEAAVEEGTFRADLFYRLRGLEIRLPALRDRGEDILLLAKHFLHLIAAEQGTEPKGLSQEAMRTIEGYHWPGNVRELRRAIESVIVLAPGPEIRREDLPEFLVRTDSSSAPFELHLSAAQSISFPDVVGSFETMLLQWAMQKTGGNQSEAARALGLPRTTFQSKLRDRDLL